jgi:hypothetical protein
MNEKYLNSISIASILMFLAGILLYIYWGIRYGVWYDIGIYSITIVFVLGGIFGFLLTYFQKEKAE